MPTNTEILVVLQHLADLKIASFKAKWSKSADREIEQLENAYNDVVKLKKYFLKR